MFWVSVPIGIFGAMWSCASLHEVGVRRGGKLDIPGNITFTLGLSALITGVTYGLKPDGDSPMGWTNPWVLGGLIGGVLLLVLFAVVKLRTKDPMLHMDLFRIPAFGLGNLAGLMASISHGGPQFILIICLQGIWLPRWGYSYESTPLWASLFLLPLTIGFFAAGPLSGWLSDRFGARRFAAAGSALTALSFLGLRVLPVDVGYPMFATLSPPNGVGSGTFSSPSAAVVMNSVPSAQRGSASGMRMTFANLGSSRSIGVSFFLMVVGLAATMPTTLSAGLAAQGVPNAVATQLGLLPPVGNLFAAFLGINPIAALLGPTGLFTTLPAGKVATLTGTTFFPSLISDPFHSALVLVFAIAAAMMVVAAVASWYAGGELALELSHADCGERTGEEPQSYARVEDAAVEAAGDRFAAPDVGAELVAATRQHYAPSGKGEPR